MPRLRHPSGATVNVPAEKVERLLGSGLTRVEEKQQRSKAASSKASSAESDED